MNLRSFVKALAGAVFCTLLAQGVAASSDRATKPEAEAIVKKAIAYIKANGTTKAYEEFTNGSSFKDRDLYIVVFDLTGKNLAHGAHPRQVGKDLIELKDPNGMPTIKMFVAMAKENGKGWVSGYQYMNPVTKKAETKALYLERIGETFVGSGVYSD